MPPAVSASIEPSAEAPLLIVNKHPEVILECRTTYCPAILDKEDLFTIVDEVNCDIYTIQQFRNRSVLDDALIESEEPNPHDMEEIARAIKEKHPNQTINLKTAEFGQKVFE